MRLFLFNNYSLNKNNDLMSIFLKTKEVANQTNPNGFNKMFYFDESGYHTVSAVERAVKKIPELSKYKYFVPEETDRIPAHNALSNLPKEWQESNPNGISDTIDINQLELVAQGIPKSFPFYYASFIFDKIDWFGKGSIEKSAALGEDNPSACFPYGERSYFSPSIIFQSNWGYSKRELRLFSMLELEEPQDSTSEFPEPNKDVYELINSIGKVKGTIICPVPSEKERKRIKELEVPAIKLVEDYNNNIDAILSGIPLSNILEKPESFTGTFDNVSPKKSLTNILKESGYKYLSKFSRQGCYFLFKRTEVNNQIVLAFDLAPMARTFSWGLTIQGPFWSHQLDLYFYPNTHKQYAVTGQEILDKLVENARDIAEYLEKTLISKIEAIYGPAPSWFRYYL